MSPVKTKSKAKTKKKADTQPKPKLENETFSHKLASRTRGVGWGSGGTPEVEGSLSQLIKQELPSGNWFYRGARIIEYAGLKDPENIDQEIRKIKSRELVEATLMTQPDKNPGGRPLSEEPTRVRTSITIDVKTYALIKEYRNKSAVIEAAIIEKYGN